MAGRVCTICRRRSVSSVRPKSHETTGIASPIIGSDTVPARAQRHSEQLDRITISSVPILSVGGGKNMVSRPSNWWSSQLSMGPVFDSSSPGSQPIKKNNPKKTTVKRANRSNMHFLFEVIHHCVPIVPIFLNEQLCSLGPARVSFIHMLGALTEILAI